MGKIYRWRDEAAIERFKDCYMRQSKLWEENVGFGGDIEVKYSDIQGNIIKVCVDGKIYNASTGVFNSYWCLFLAKDIKDYFISVEPEVVPKAPEPEDCFVIEKSSKSGERSIVHGPFNRGAADKFAIQRLRNAADDVRCIVTQQVGEAKAIYKVE